jgi:hypothetical protein
LQGGNTTRPDITALPPPGLDPEISRRQDSKKAFPGISRDLSVEDKISRRTPFSFRNLPADPLFFSYLPAEATSEPKIRIFGGNKVLGKIQPKSRLFGRFYASPGGEVHLRGKSPGFAKFLVATLRHQRGQQLH